MPPTFVNADAVDPERLHAGFVAAFADYLVGPITLPPADWPAFLARQAVDLRASRVVLDTGGAVSAFAFVAWRDARRARLATMGACPAARATGAAPALLDELIARLAAQGAERLELEVFAANERALALYRRRGFEACHALHGYTLTGATPAGTGGAPDVQAVDRDDAMAWLHATMALVDDLPLQVTPACLARSAAALQAWRAGAAQVVFHPADDGAVRIASLVDRDPDQPGARQLLQALRVRHAGRTLHVPALQRLDVGGRALRELGAVPQPLHQWLMLRPLRPRSAQGSGA